MSVVETVLSYKLQYTPLTRRCTPPMPIGLIKHGKNVDIPAGTPLVAYVEQDIWLAPME